MSTKNIHNKKFSASFPEQLVTKKMSLSVYIFQSVLFIKNFRSFFLFAFNDDKKATLRCEKTAMTGVSCMEKNPSNGSHPNNKIKTFFFLVFFFASIQDKKKKEIFCFVAFNFFFVLWSSSFMSCVFEKKKFFCQTNTNSPIFILYILDGKKERQKSK